MFFQLNEKLKLIWHEAASLSSLFYQTWRVCSCRVGSGRVGSGPETGLIICICGLLRLIGRLRKLKRPHFVEAADVWLFEPRQIFKSSWEMQRDCKRAEAPRPVLCSLTSCLISQTKQSNSQRTKWPERTTRFVLGLICLCGGPCHPHSFIQSDET